MGSKVFWIGIVMKEWKVKQILYHRLNPETPDMYGPDDIEMMDDVSDEAIIEMIKSYMGGYVPEKVIYPAKSYFVALVYSRLLRDHFGEDPIVVLNDADLLHGNDPYFVQYSEAQNIYDAVLEAFGWDFDITLGEIPDVANYFSEEFMLDQDA